MSYISDFKSAPISLFGVNGGNTTTDASLATIVGSSWESPDGRRFTLVQNGATALVSGVLVQTLLAWQWLEPKLLVQRLR